MRADETSPSFGWFFGGGVFPILGVAATLYGVLDVSCLLGSLVFHGLSYIGGWVFLAMGFVLVAVGSAKVMVAFRTEN